MDERVFYYDDGNMKSLPASWTSVGTSGEERIPDKLEAYFRTKDLLDLYELFAGLGGMVIGDLNGDEGD